MTLQLVGDNAREHQSWGLGVSQLGVEDSRSYVVPFGMEPP